MSEHYECLAILNAIIDHSCWIFILHALSLKCDDFKLTHSKLWTVGKIFSVEEKKNVLLFIKLSACVHHHTINHKLFVLKLFYDLFYNNLQLELARGRSITNNLVDKIKNGLWNALGHKKLFMDELWQRYLNKVHAESFVLLFKWHPLESLGCDGRVKYLVHHVRIRLNTRGSGTLYIVHWTFAQNPPFLSEKYWRFTYLTIFLLLHKPIRVSVLLLLCNQSHGHGKW